MIDEKRLKEAFLKVRKEFTQLNWKLEKMEDRFDDLASAIQKLGGDAPRIEVRDEVPLVEKPFIEKEVKAPVVKETVDTPEVKESIEAPVVKETVESPAVELKKPKSLETPSLLDDEEEFY